MYVLSKMTITDFCERRKRENISLFLLVEFDANWNYNTTFFADSDDDKQNVFRVYRVQSCPSYGNRYDTDASLKRKLRDMYSSVVMYYGSMYRRECEKYPIDILLITDDWNEVEKMFDELNILYPQKYQYDPSVKCNFSIKNNTTFDDVLILDMVERFGFERVKTAEINRINNSYNAVVFNKNTDAVYSHFERYYADKSLSDWVNKYFVDEPNSGGIKICQYNQPSKFEFFYVTATETCICFSKVSAQSKVDDDGNIDINVKKLYEYKYDVISGSHCTKFMARSNRESTPMDMFNINSKNINSPDGIFLYDGSTDVYRFFLSNKNFFDKCGFTQFVSNMHMSMNLNAAMVLYMTIIYEYPQVELLIKMGHECLVEDFFKELMVSGRRDLIAQKVKELDQLIDRTTTKGSMVLRFPSYIGDYLRNKKCGLHEYLFWRDVYELEHISKENFEKFLELPERIIINMGIDDRSNGWYNIGIQEIIKYPGYSLIKTIKYIVAEGLKMIEDDKIFFNPFNRLVNILKDTLSMAEDLDIQIESYPSELVKVHNEIMVLYQDKEASGLNKKAEEIANSCEKELNNVFSSNASNLPHEAMNELTYVFPKSQGDFTKEGINQHNCVGGYFNRVVSGNCIIFFVRKKDDIDSSYITAECRDNGTGQVMFSNNRPVPTDSKEYKYCQFISNKLRNAKQQGRILGLTESRGILAR